MLWTKHARVKIGNTTVFQRKHIHALRWSSSPNVNKEKSLLLIAWFKWECWKWKINKIWMNFTTIEKRITKDFSNKRERFESQTTWFEEGREGDEIELKTDGTTVKTWHPVKDHTRKMREWYFPPWESEEQTGDATGLQRENMGRWSIALKHVLTTGVFRLSSFQEMKEDENKQLYLSTTGMLNSCISQFFKNWQAKLSTGV